MFSNLKSVQCCFHHVFTSLFKHIEVLEFLKISLMLKSGLPLWFEATRVIVSLKKKKWCTINPSFKMVS